MEGARPTRCSGMAFIVEVGEGRRGVKLEVDAEEERRTWVGGREKGRSVMEELRWEVRVEDAGGDAA